MPSIHSPLLLSLPNELLHESALYLDPIDVNALMRSNQRLRYLLAPLLDRLLTEYADRALSWAARNKNERFFHLALTRGADALRFVDGTTKPPLFFAVVNGWDDSASMLIDHGAHAIGRPDSGTQYTALYAAVICKHLSTTRLLLDRGWSATLPATNIRDMEPLHSAILSSTDSIITLLITHGADVNIRVSDQSMLETAAQRPGCDLAIVQLLFAHGFNGSVVDRSGETALDTAFREAVKLGNYSVAEFILGQGADIKCRSPVRYETALHTAVRLMRWPVVSMLLRHGIEINALNRERETALFSAAIGRALDDPHKKYFIFGTEDDGQRERPALLTDFIMADRLPVVKLLLEAGIDVNSRDRDGETVLFRAACRGSTPIIELLLHHGADINLQNGTHNSTALHAAAKCGDVAVVQTMLAHGSDINAQTGNGSTALHLALQHADLDTASLLLNHGIDIAARSKLLGPFDSNPCIAVGATALYLVVRWGHEAFARALLAKGASVDDRYHLKRTEECAANLSLKERVVAMFAEAGHAPKVYCEGTDGDLETRRPGDRVEDDWYTG